MLNMMPHNTAVIVVDAQNDYCVPEGVIGSLGYSVDGRVDVARSITAFVDKARPLLKAVFFIRTETPSWGRSETQIAQYARSHLKRAPSPHLSEWFHVAPSNDDHVMTKSKYSAFSGTGLDSALRALNVRNVVICGFTTEVCVDSTVRDAFHLDYHVVCLSDCTAGSTPERHSSALDTIDLFFGRVSNSSDTINDLVKAV